LVDDNQEIPGTVSIDLSQPGDAERFPIEELLQQSMGQYDYAFDYQVDNVIQALADNNIGLPPNIPVPEGINDGADMFVGILMMDAAVGNSDRHDRNLDIVRQSNGQLYLSPAFDHGYSLGAAEDNDLRSWIDPQGYNKYHNSSSFSYQGEDISGVEAFKQAAQMRPQAAKIWLNELQTIDNQQVSEIFERIPKQILTPEAGNFAKDLLKYNREQLLSLNIDYRQTVNNLNLSDSQLKMPVIDTSQAISDVLFDLASSAKYIALNETGKSLDSSSQFKVVIEKDSQNLSIYADGKSITFDQDFNLVRNEFSDREIRQLNQKTQVTKQQSLERSHSQQIQRDTGLSL
jgi:hypothetical protein